jgi:hypothetical protein
MEISQRIRQRRITSAQLFSVIPALSRNPETQQWIPAFGLVAKDEIASSLRSSQ